MIEDYENVIMISLTQGKFACIDIADLGLVGWTKWYAHRCRGNWYAKADKGRRVRHRFLMHRTIVGQNCPLDIDHADRNGLNNRRMNLRPCSRNQNLCNQPPRRPGRFKGTRWQKKVGKWQARMTYNGNELHLGYFLTEQEAASAYDKMASRLRGEFAFLNFPVTTKEPKVKEGAGPAKKKIMTFDEAFSKKH